MKLEEIENWLKDRSRVHVEKEHIEEYLAYVNKLLTVVKAAEGYMDGIKSRRPEYIPFYRLVRVLEDLEK